MNLKGEEEIEGDRVGLLKWNWLIVQYLGYAEQLYILYTLIMLWELFPRQRVNGCYFLKTNSY